MLPRTRPGAVTLVAVLNILLGLLALAGAGLQGYTTYQLRPKTEATAVPEPPPPADPNAAPKGPPRLGGMPALPPPPKNAPPPAEPTYATDPVGIAREHQRFLFVQDGTFELFSAGLVGVLALNGLVLVSSGIGLLGLRPFARTIMFLFLMWSTAVAVGAGWYAQTFAIPGTQRWESERAVVVRDKLLTPTQTAQALAVTGLVLGVGYPLFACLILMLPRSRAGFQSVPKPPAPEPGPFDAPPEPLLTEPAAGPPQPIV